MDWERRHRSVFAVLTVRLDPGESLQAESGALVTHTEGVTVEAGDDGLLSSVRRSLLGDDLALAATVSAPDGGDVTLAPPLPGDVVHRELGGETVLVQSGAFLACCPDVALASADGSLDGTRPLLSVEGSGPLFLAPYGAVDAVSLSGGETHVVAAGHVVAFEASVEASVERVGGLRSTLSGGESPICTLTGPGTVWVQSRSHDALLSWLAATVPAADG